MVPPKFKPSLKLGFSRSVQNEKEQIDETQTQIFNFPRDLALIPFLAVMAILRCPIS